MENESEIEKVANHCGKSPASDEVCHEKTVVNTEKQVPKSPRKVLVCFVSNVSRWVGTNLTLTITVK